MKFMLLDNHFRMGSFALFLSLKGSDFVWSQEVMVSVDADLHLFCAEIVLSLN